MVILWYLRKRMFTLSDNFWRRLNLIAGFFVILSTVGFLVFMAHIEIKDLDLWLHIGMGRHIVANNFHVPSVDILSCTVAGTPWVNHEWLFQVIVYAIYNNWGVDGLITMQVWLVAVTFLLLVFLGYSRKNLFLVVLSLLLVSLVYQTRLTFRPDLYSLFFYAVYVVVLAIFIHRKWSIWALFILQVLWANMHGFFFFGPFIVGMGLLGEWLKRSVKLPWEWNKVGRLTDKEYYHLKLIFGMVILACFLTPTGIHGAVYPLKVLFQISGDSKIFFTKIVELQRPITQSTLFSTGEWSEYKVLILVSLLSFVFNRRKLDIGVFIFWLFFLVFSLMAVRNLTFFAFAAYFAFVINIATIRFKDIVPLRFTSRKFLYITSIVAHVLLVFWVMRLYANVANNGYFDFQKYERKSEFGGISQHQFPIEAADFLVKNKVRGNFYNDFNSGAYLVGRCFPNIKVFIDGRTEVYGPAFFKKYLQVDSDDNVDVFKAMLKRFQITGVFLNSVHNALRDNVLNYLYKSPDWALVYFDHDGVVFLKNIPINRDVIIHNRIDLKTWKAKGMDLYRLGSKDVSPYPYFNRAFTLVSLELYDAALSEARAALAINPAYSGAYKILGKVSAKKKDFAAAYENFRIASIMGSNDKNARLNMALALVDLKRYDQAAVAYEKIMEIWPDLAVARFQFAKVNIFLGKYSLALDGIKTGYRLDSAASASVLELGDMLRDAKVYDLARQTYQLVLDKEPKSQDPYLRICQVYEKTNQREKCVLLLKKGLGKNPESKELKEKLRSLGGRVNSKK